MNERRITFRAFLMGILFAALFMQCKALIAPAMANALIRGAAIRK